jgi:superoxide dismutase, Cu-Zn family
MKRAAILTCSILLGLGASCVFVHATDDSPPSHGHEHTAAAGAHGAVATASIESRSGSTLTGKATFTETTGGVLVEIVVHHAPPGWHAVHVHEKGDCSAEDGSSAGGHFNPETKSHGSPHAPEHHAGDLGNLIVDEHGEGRHLLLMPGLTVAEGPAAVRGRAIIIHASVDDLVTQPTGNAGGRIGCGVIQ